MEYPVRAGSGGVSNDLDSIFTPDIMLPAQFFDGLRSRVREPERRLALAVLEDAVNAYRRGATAEIGTKGASDRREAWQWLFGEAVGMFSFGHVCEILNIEPSYLRRGLSVWEGELKRRAAGGRRTQQIGVARQRTRRAR